LHGPSRSLNLNPLDFYLWGHLKNTISVRHIKYLDKLSQKIENYCQQIQNKPGIFEHVQFSMRKREFCVEMNRGSVVD